MNRRVFLVLAVLVALGGLVWWKVGGTGGREPDVASLADDEGTVEAEPEPDLAPMDSMLANSGRDLSPAKELGSVIARVVRKTDRLPLGGVVVRLDGAGAADDRIDLTTTSDGKGDVRFDGVPVGSAYAVHVHRDPHPPVDRMGVGVKARETTDLGVIALEALGHVDALVLDEDRIPIKGATVSVSFDDDPVSQLDESPWPLEPGLPGGFAVGTTNDRGLARIEGIPPGSVAVRATMPTHRGRTFRALVPSEAPRVAVVVFVLSAGRAYIGRVVEADGSPIKDALVEFGRDDVERFETKRTTRTADDGAFAMRGCLDVGPFSVRASAAKHAPTIVTPEVWKPIEIVLSGGCTLVVRTIDAVSRAPVSSARVSAFSTALDPRRPNRAKYEGRSGVDGVAELEFPAGSGFSLRIVEELHRTLVLDRVGPGATVTGGELIGDVRTHVAASERRELTAELTRGDSLSCWVTTPGPPYVPIAGALVRLSHGERKTAELRSDAKGELVFSNVLLADRSPVLYASALGHYVTETPVSDVRVALDGLVHKQVFLASRAQPIPTAGRPFGSEEQTLSMSVTVLGRVVAADRRGVSGAWVRVRGFPSVVRTASDGTFRLAEVPLRFDPRQRSLVALDIVVEKGGSLAAASRNISPASADRPVNFGDVELIAPAEIVGVTLRDRSNDRTRYPLVDLVRASDGGSVVETAVGGEFGDFRFTGLADGKYRVRARDGRGAGESFQIEIDRGRAKPTFIEVRLYDASICAGRIEDREGTPLGGVAVWLDTDRTNRPWGDAVPAEVPVITDAEGAFRFLCFGVRPLAVQFLPDSERRGSTIHVAVHAGEDNVIRLKTYVKPPRR